MQKTFAVAVILMGVLALAGCGDSLTQLNRLAAAGAIHEAAPVTTKLQIQIAAPPAKVWDLLVDAPSWPKWHKQIESVTAMGRLADRMRFSWKTGGTSIQSQVQLFEPQRRLSWTGTAFTAKAVHVWELQPAPGNQTLLTMKESMDGPWMAKIYPSQKLAEADTEWLTALKRAAEAAP
jgi:uncharacterized protein YndB with AHSA1/START domain